METLSTLRVAAFEFQKHRPEQGVVGQAGGEGNPCDRAGDD
jgi:hypothetical protein